MLAMAAPPTSFVRRSPTQSDATGRCSPKKADRHCARVLDPSPFPVAHCTRLPRSHAANHGERERVGGGIRWHGEACAARAQASGESGRARPHARPGSSGQRLGGRSARGASCQRGSDAARARGGRHASRRDARVGTRRLRPPLRLRAGATGSLRAPDPGARARASSARGAPRARPRTPHQPSSVEQGPASRARRDSGRHRCADRLRPRAANPAPRAGRARERASARHGGFARSRADDTRHDSLYTRGARDLELRARGRRARRG